MKREEFIKNFEKVEHHKIVMRDLQGLGAFTEGLIDLIERVGLKKGQSMIEIGSYYGASSVLFASTGIDLTCVDIWAKKDSIINNTAEEWGNVEALFDKNTKEYPNVTKFKGLTPESAKAFKEGSVDFVYIDADHTYEAVKADIAAWLPKVKAGGWIGGHDYTIYAGVRKAVDEKFPSCVTFRDSSWAVKL